MSQPDRPPENLPAELIGLAGVTLAACLGGLLLTGFCLIAPNLTRTRGATSSGRLVHIHAKIEAGDELTEGERLLLEESRGDGAPSKE